MLSSILHDAEIIFLAEAYKGKRSAPATTKQGYWDLNKHNLKWLAAKMGYNSLEECDNQGWTLFHHLCNAVKFSKYVGLLLLDILSGRQPYFPGDMSEAMKLTTNEDTSPPGRTPIMLLLEGSDTGFQVGDILTAGLSNGILTTAHFEMEDPNVIVFSLAH